MGYLNLNGLNLRVKSIDWDSQIKSIIKPFVGDGGSNTTITGDAGRLLTLTVSGRQSNIQSLMALKEVNMAVPLISESNADYNGTYFITSVKASERKKGIWDVTITLQEEANFNTVRMNFIDYNVIPNYNFSVGNVKTLKIGQRWNPG